MRFNGGYGTYHGKSGLRTFLKVLIFLLLAVLLLMIAGFFLLEKYMVYDANGTRLELPFFERQTEGVPPPTARLPLVVESLAPTPTPVPETMRGVGLPRAALADGTAAAQVTVAGGMSAIFDMKADDGTLGYVSAVALAKAAGASSADPALNAAIQTLNGGALYTVARVSCFRDNLTPKEQNKLAVRTNSGYNWRDEGEIRWLSPTSEAARQYVSDICLELAQLGFDEILLDNSAYPTLGNLTHIKKGAAYDETQFSAVINAFYAQVRQALAAYPEVKLSIMTTEGIITAGSDAVSGQNVAGMLLSADRLWAPLSATGWTQCAALLGQAGMAKPESHLVPVTAQAGLAGEHWAVLPPKP